MPIPPSSNYQSTTICVAIYLCVFHIQMQNIGSIHINQHVFQLRFDESSEIHVSFSCATLQTKGTANS